MARERAGAADGGQRTLPGRDRVTMAHEALSMAARREHDVTFVMMSGGTDSVVAADAVLRWGPEFGIEPDAVCHINTGVGLGITRETVRRFCERRDVAYIEGINRRSGEMLAHRVLEHGWPGRGNAAPDDAGGHQMEFINRKERVMDALYRAWPGDHLWISGARAAESDRRAVNVGDSPVSFGTAGDRKPRLSWLCPCHGWSDEQKRAHIEKHDLPVTPADDFVGHSGECVACSFDHPAALPEIAVVDPELAYALSLLCAWVYQRVRAGRADFPLHRAVWGWPRRLEADDGETNGNRRDESAAASEGEGDACAEQRTLSMAGCADCSARECYARREIDGTGDDADGATAFWPPSTA